MVRMLFITDTHLKSTAPQGRCDNYTETAFAKLNEVVRLACELKVDAVIHGGDLFDIPQASFRLMSRVAEFFFSLPCPAFVLPGNHDTPGYSPEALPGTSLGFLAGVRVFTLLREPVTLGEATVYPLPLRKVPVAEDYRISRHNSVNIIVAHDNIVPAPVHPEIPHLVISPDLSNADLVLLGHWHPGWQEPIRSGSTIYVNPGSLLRTDRGEGSKNRKVSAALITVDAGKIYVKYIPLASARPYEQVFRPANEGTILDARTLVGQFNAAEIGFTDAFAILEATSSKQVAAVVKDTLHDIVRDSAAPISWPNRPAIITDLEIEGFQSHICSRFDFQPGLNVITGQSDSGKSAIIRSLRWLFYDKPKGASSINLACKKQQVTTRFADGTVLSRSRTKSSTGHYQVTMPDNATLTLTSVKGSLPPEIQTIHRSPLLSLAGEEVSILAANQFDPPFLIGWPGGKVAAILDEAAKNDLALQVIREMRRRGEELSQRAKAIESHIDSLSIQISAACAVESLAPQVSVLSESLRLLKDQERRLQDLRQARDRYLLLLTLENQIADPCADLAQSLPAFVLLAQTAGEHLENASRQYLVLQATIAKHNYIADRTAAIASKMTSVPDLLANAAQDYIALLTETGLCPLCGSFWDSALEAESIAEEERQMRDKLQAAKDMLGNIKNIGTAEVERVLSQLKAKKALFEKRLAEAHAALSLVQEYIAEKEKFEQECLAKYDMHPSDLENAINNLASQVSTQTSQIEEALKSLEERCTSLTDALAGLRARNHH